jgi:hypothetical protein
MAPRTIPTQKKVTVIMVERQTPDGRPIEDLASPEKKELSYQAKWAIDGGSYYFVTIRDVP